MFKVIQSDMANAALCLNLSVFQIMITRAALPLEGNVHLLYVSSTFGISFW